MEWDWLGLGLSLLNRERFMPGYIIHLSVAKRFLELLKMGAGVEWSLSDRNSFYLGTLLPDATDNKIVTHFRDVYKSSWVISEPNIKEFDKKYTKESFVPPYISGMNNIDKDQIFYMGYRLHLFVDHLFFVKYLPEWVSFLGQDRREARFREDLRWGYCMKKNTWIPGDEFFTDKYYYGDFTILNQKLISAYKLRLEFDWEIRVPETEECAFMDKTRLRKELGQFLQKDESRKIELKVFEYWDMIDMIEELAVAFIEEYR